MLLHRGRAPLRGRVARRILGSRRRRRPDARSPSWRVCRPGSAKSLQTGDERSSDRHKPSELADLRQQSTPNGWPRAAHGAIWPTSGNGRRRMGCRGAEGWRRGLATAPKGPPRSARHRPLFPPRASARGIRVHTCAIQSRGCPKRRGGGSWNLIGERGAPNIEHEPGMPLAEGAGRCAARRRGARGAGRRAGRTRGRGRQARGGAVLSRTTSSVASSTRGWAGDSPSAIRAPARRPRPPSRTSGWRTVVSGGPTHCATGRSSKPTTLTSSGMWRRASRAAW